MTLEERVSYSTSMEALIKSRGNFEDDELIGEGEMIIYYRNGNGREERKGTFRYDELMEGEIIFYHGNGQKKEEHRGIFKHGVLRRGEIIYYDGDVTRKEKRPYFLR